MKCILIVAIAALGCLYVEGFIGYLLASNGMANRLKTLTKQGYSASSSSLTDFDDSVFDNPFRDDDAGYSNSRSRETPKNARDVRSTYNSRATVATSVAGVLDGQLKRGDAIRVRVKRMDRLGAYVELLDHLQPNEAGELIRGMILAFEVEVWNSAQGRQLAPGDIVEQAFVENVRPADSRVDVCLRPPGYGRVMASKVFLDHSLTYRPPSLLTTPTARIQFCPI